MGWLAIALANIHWSMLEAHASSLMCIAESRKEEMKECGAFMDTLEEACSGCIRVQNAVRVALNGPANL